MRCSLRTKNCGNADRRGQTKNYDPTIPVNFHDTSLRPVTALRYLGVWLWLDPALRWTNHVQEVSCKVEHRLSNLKAVYEMYWRVKRATMRNFYIGTVDHASLTWSTVAPGQLKKLAKLQLWAELMIIGCMFSTSYAALDVEAGLEPFALHFRRRATMEIFRLRELQELNHASAWVQVRSRQWKVAPLSCTASYGLD